MKIKDPVLYTGLCAYGMSGKVFHAPLIHCHAGFQLTGVVERHQKTAKKRFINIRSFDSAEDMLNDRDINLVVVNTPNTTHFDLVRQALLAGKHVIVEKPFTSTVQQAEELIALAERQKKFLVVFQNRRWDSDFLAVQQVVQEGSLGRIIEAEFHYDRYRMELSQKQHKEIAGPGVGNIYDLGPHLVDQAIALFGKPTGVSGIVRTNRKDSKVDDFFAITLLYPGLTVTLKSSLLVREPIPAYVLHGTLGSFLKPRGDVQEAKLQDEGLPLEESWGKERAASRGLLNTVLNGRPTREKIVSPNGNYLHFYSGVYNAIVHGDPSPVPLQDSLLNMRIIEAALISNRELRVVEV